MSVPVLVLCLSESCKLETKRYFDSVKDKFHDCDFVYPNTDTGEVTDMLEIYNESCSIVEEKSIKIILSSCVRSALVQSALVDTFPHLYGASFESSFLCFHKPLARDIIIPEKYNLSHSRLWTKEGYPLDSIEVKEALEGVGLPALAKPFMGSGSIQVHKLASRKDYKIFGAECHEDLKSIIHPMRKFLLKFWNCHKFPEALKPCFILETYINHSQNNVRIHSVDCLIYGGKLMPWAISDYYYWEHKPECLKGVGLPTTLPFEMRLRTWNVLRDIIHNLHGLGYDYQFLNAEVFSLENGTVKILGLNSCISHKMRYLYSSVLKSGNGIRTLIDIAIGQFPYGPQVVPDSFGLCAQLYTFGSGLVCDVLDMESVKKHSNIELLHDGVASVTPKGQTGFLLGYIHLTGKNLQDCLGQINEIKHSIYKQKDTSPWFDLDKTG